MDNSVQLHFTCVSRSLGAPNFPGYFQSFALVLPRILSPHLAEPFNCFCISMLARFRSGLSSAIKALNSSKVAEVDDTDHLSWKYDKTTSTLAFYECLANIGEGVSLRVLDVGCGKLRTISMLVDNGLQPAAYTGIDIAIDREILSLASLFQSVQGQGFLPNVMRTWARRIWKMLLTTCSL